MGLWEDTMGLSDRQRAVVQHHKDERWHTHVVWNRIDPATDKAVNVGRDHFQAKKVAREIERELSLRQVENQRQNRERKPREWETEPTKGPKAARKQIEAQISTPDALGQWAGIPTRPGSLRPDACAR